MLNKKVHRFGDFKKWVKKNKLIDDNLGLVIYWDNSASILERNGNKLIEKTSFKELKLRHWIRLGLINFRAWIIRKYNSIDLNTEDLDDLLSNKNIAIMLAFLLFALWSVVRVL